MLCQLISIAVIFLFSALKDVKDTEILVLYSRMPRPNGDTNFFICITLKGNWSYNRKDRIRGNIKLHSGKESGKSFLEGETSSSTAIIVCLSESQV